MLLAGCELAEFEWVEVEREFVFRGKGGTSSIFWLNLLTRSFKDDCRFRGLEDRVGLDFVDDNGDCSVEEVELYLEPCGEYTREVKVDGFEKEVRDEGGLCLR